MINKTKIILLIMCVGVMLSQCTKKDSGATKEKEDKSTKVTVSESDRQLGISTIRPESLFSESLSIPAVKYVGKAPGAGNKKLPRSYENAPPIIPHSTEGFLPIKKGNNACLTCHMPSNNDPKVAILAIATRISSTHLRGLDGNYLKGELNKAYFNCSQCHVPQANLSAAKDNIFKPIFNAEANKLKSTLKIKTIPFSKSSKSKVK